MKEVNVTVFGSNTPVLPSGCSCGGANCSPVSMREDAEDLKKHLAGKYGDAVKYRYVDVQSDEIKEYPDISKILNTVKLPLTVINGAPSFHGGFSITMIADAVGKLVE